MGWDKVGNFLKENAGTGAKLVGSLITGNVPGAIASGVAMIAGATGTDDPIEALETLQNNPEALVKLKQIAADREAEINRHLEATQLAQLEDDQASHEQTQMTVRSGDNSEDEFVRRTRPAQAWVSLIAALVYAFYMDAPDIYILGALLTIPFSYHGLRQIGKWKSSETLSKIMDKGK